MNVLVVDDQEVRLQFFRDQFRLYPLFPHKLVTANDVSNAEFHLALPTRWDVVFLDHDLNDWGVKETGKRPQERTGADVARHIVSLHKAKRPSQVVVHSWNDPGARDIIGILDDAGVPATRWVFDSGRPMPMATWGLAP